MGNGALRKYRAQPETDGYDPNVWRKPNPKKKAAPETTDGPQAAQPLPAKPPSPTVHAGSGPGAKSATDAGIAAGRTAVSTAQALHAAHRTWSKPPPNPAAQPEEEDDELLLTDCSNLADAANKAFEELLAKKNNSRGDFNALFYMHEMKDGVERAAKRVECLSKELAEASSKQEEKCKALEDCAAEIEERGTGNVAQIPFRLGDLAVRKGGKGLCEIMTIHYEAQPPRVEVRMYVTSTITGTEADTLLTLTAAQLTSARKVVRELELAKNEHSKIEESLTAAQEELRQQHLALSARLEEKLKEDVKVTGGEKSTTPGPPLPGVMTPSGLPNVDVFRKWVGPPGPSPASGGNSAGARSPKLPQQDYPEVKGVKEDLRPPDAAGSKSASPQGGTASSLPRETSSAGRSAPTAERPPAPSGAANLGASTRSCPTGFPTMDDLNKMGQSARLGAHQTPVRPSRPGGPSQASFRQSASVPRVQEAGTRASSQQQQAPQQQQPTQSQQQQDQQQSTQGQPPAEWVAYSTIEGQQYFHNPRTGETVWQLPPGARATHATTQSTYYKASGQAAGSGSDEGFGRRPKAGENEDDPFADLRHQEQEMQREREEWTQWYAQYCNWYSKQGQTGAPGATSGKESEKAKGASGASAQPDSSSKSSQQAGSAKLAPRGPPPPKLDAGFEDKAMYVVKSAILKEMESMVEQGAAIDQRKKALRVLQMRWHPDKNPEKVEVAKSIFQFLEETKPWFLHEATPTT